MKMFVGHSGHSQQQRQVQGGQFQQQMGQQQHFQPPVPLLLSLSIPSIVFSHYALSSFSEYLLKAPMVFDAFAQPPHGGQGGQFAANANAVGHHGDYGNMARYSPSLISWFTIYPSLSSYIIPNFFSMCSNAPLLFCLVDDGSFRSESDHAPLRLF